MIRKVALSGFAMVTLFLAMFVGPSSFALAEEPNVMDWLDEEQPANQEPETNAALNDDNQKSPMLLIGQLIFYTLLILVMIYGLIKFLASRQKRMEPNQAIHMIGGTALGNNRSLQLVKVGGKVYLLGVADQITLIKEFSDEEEIGTFDDDSRKPAFFTGSLFGSLSKQTETRENGDRKSVV